MSDVDDAILALLRATGVNLHDGHVTDSDDNENTISAPLPYVVYFTTPGWRTSNRVGGPGRARVVEFQVTAVGSTREQADWAGGKAEDALHGRRVEVNGRSRKITRTLDNPFTRRDTTWTRPGGKPLFNDVRRYVVAQ